MIIYKIDKQSHDKTNTQIKEMERVITEMSPQLQKLHELIIQHESTISSPSISNYRDQLQDLIVEAIDLTQVIALKSQKLVNVSEQAGKHLTSLEDNLGVVLRSNSIETTTAPAHFRNS
jgi:hypothetical protein